ncbi:RING finger and transmembrane domain-containing protein 2 [Heracleum sosnowskyi]|uniref:RING finger and transmembrane domain-containing protein 2 n=1 Tax=Heracleum sosnowskyi TaxID=360622 RepID=A0AAD8J7T1_9APIA|nr:RING finger and transmembrane domain-containing protein 2 [Heracleum sosnowskyi]
MEASPRNSECPSFSSSSSNSSSAFHFVAASSFLHNPLSSLLEYSGVLHTHDHLHSSADHHSLTPTATRLHDFSSRPRSSSNNNISSSNRNISSSSSQEEVSISIIGATGEQEENRANSPTHSSSPERDHLSPSGGHNAERNGGGAAFNHNRDSSSYQRYDIQQAARWIEQLLPFSLLLLLVFIRQHLQGFILTIWVAAFMFKSNDILRKQTALKGERRLSTLFGISLVFTLQVISVYWWYLTDLLNLLVMIPPKSIPPFWHAIFIVVVNDTLVRQASMVLKCGILMYYKNSRGKIYREQGQLLTLVEYILLLYRALLPAPIWYRFFYNKEFGSLFSSLITGLYLIFKLTSIVEKVQNFFASLKALSRTEIKYGTHATSEQVSAAGDLCAICQEKMLAPILLRCKHIFCEDCVSEWFERERTCPLCRALVKSADLRSFGDGSTSLFFQLF